MYSAFQIFLEIFTISKLRLRFPSSELRREDWTSVSGQTHQSSTKVLSTHSWRCQRTISFPRRYQIRSSTTCYSQGWIKCFWMSTFGPIQDCFVYQCSVNEGRPMYHIIFLDLRKALKFSINSYSKYFCFMNLCSLYHFFIIFGIYPSLQERKGGGAM